jgi:hypothetical protein
VIARKKQLNSLLGDDDHHLGKVVLFRDPTDERYPCEPKDGEPPGRWVACRAVGLRSPGHLLVLHREHLAATSPDGQKWDAILGYDAAARHVESELRGLHAWGLDESERGERTPHDFWNEYIPDAERAWLKVYRFVPLDRVITIDPLGDGYYPVPHVFVDFAPTTGPFSEREFTALERVGMHGGRIDLTPSKSNRAAIFPKDVPSEDDPPPDGFDDTSSQASTLSESADEKLKGLLSAIEESRKPPADAQNEKSRVEIVQLKMRPFKEWRETIALPVFSAFVSRLRTAGHTARVVVRTIETSALGHESRDSIELRVRMHVGSRHNPAYRPSGHVRVSISGYSGWRLDVSPPRDETGSRYSASPRPKLENMPQEQLETEVVGMLERLKTRGY